jgi:hypothetical protein
VITINIRGDVAPGDLYIYGRAEAVVLIVAVNKNLIVFESWTNENKTIIRTYPPLGGDGCYKRSRLFCYADCVITI